jgi:hypothetical protein
MTHTPLVIIPVYFYVTHASPAAAANLVGFAVPVKRFLSSFFHSILQHLGISHGRDGIEALWKRPYFFVSRTPSVPSFLGRDDSPNGRIDPGHGRLTHKLQTTGVLQHGTASLLFGQFPSLAEILSPLQHGIIKFLDIFSRGDGCQSTT